MSNLHELVGKFLGRKRPVTGAGVSVNPAEGMVTVVVDPTPDRNKGGVNLGDLGTFNYHSDGTVVFEASADNPRIKAVRVEGRLPTGGIGSG